MPTVDYSNTVIYKIVCENECYVGHTTNFINRKHQHKRNCPNNDTKLYNFIRDKEWDMVPIEEFPCENLTQALIKEDYWRTKLDAKLNMNKPIATHNDKVQSDKARQRKYYAKHKEKILQRQKQKREKDKFILQQIKDKNAIIL